MSVLVMDIGGTMIKYAVIDEDTHILDKGSVNTPKGSKEAFVTCVKAIYEQFSDVEGIAVSMPGRIDNLRGYAYTSGALLYLDETNLTDLFHTFCDCPVSFDNDGKCAANAEAKLGSLKGIKDAIVMVFGTGVGGGIIKDGSVHRGHNFSAGEFSFLTSGSGEHTRHFGLDGSIYTLFKGYARRKGINVNTVDGHMFFDAYEAHDEDAIEAMNAFCDSVVPFIYNLQYIYDPEVFAIGGGISSRESFIEALRTRVWVYYDQLPYKLAKPELVVTEFRNDANLYGALMNYYDNKKAKGL